MDRQRESLLVAFLQENQEKLYRIAFAHVKNREDALDLVQTAIVKALQRGQSLRREECLRTWVYRILVNECLTFLRRRSKLVYLSDVEPPPQPLLTSDHEGYLDLYAAIDQLPPQLRTVVILRFFEDMKLSAIAEITATNLSTTKSRLYKALALLKLDLGGMEDDRSLSI